MVTEDRNIVVPQSEESIVKPKGLTTERLRLLTVSLAGFCTFLDLYATQPLLPLLQRVFHATEMSVSLTVSVTTLAVALAAPFAGALSERFGRKPVITAAIFALTIPTLLAATSSSLNALIGWRLLQGLFMPGIFAVTMAYIAEEWLEGGSGGAMSAYVTGNVLGGFSGRFITGLIAGHGGWQEAFLVLGSLNLAGAFAVVRWLPPSRRPHKNVAHDMALEVAEPAKKSGILHDVADHLRTPALVATYAAGFNVLFSQVATFTYVTFYLTGKPFHLSTTALASLFLVYLIGVVTTPIAGRWIDRSGHRSTFAAAVLVSSAGMLLTLLHSLVAVVVGLACLCCGVFVCQSAASSHVGVAAKKARSLATGLYVTFYYLGGSAGAWLPGIAWHWGGWPACVALIVCVQVVTAAIALNYWRTRPVLVSVKAA